MVQARYFGTGVANDAFGVATRIPTLLRDLFAEGAMSAAFVPTLARYLKRDGKPAVWRLGSHVINALILVTGLIVVAGIVFAEPLARQYASGYRDTPEKFALTVLLTRINMPFLTLIAIAAALMGMLNALGRFFIPALSPALYNVAFIVCTLTLTPLFMHFGIEPALALAIGMLAGGVVQIAVQVPLLWREGYRHTWEVDARDPGLREVLILMGPGTIGVAASQVNLLVNTWLATHVDGAVSALNYAFRLMYMPIGIFAVSVATAAIPDIAKHAADRSFVDMRATLSWSLRLTLMLSVPATLGLAVLASPIVEFIFQSGQFTSESTAMTAGALLFYAPGIIGYSLVKLASPGFYALQDARTPVLVSLLSIVSNLVLNLTLFPIMGFQGLALGTTLAANVNALVLLVLLSRRIGGLDGRHVLVSFIKILTASVFMAVVAYFVERWLHQLLPMRLFGMVEIPRLIRVAGGIGTGIGALALGAWALHVEEFRQAVDRVTRKLGVRGASKPQPPSRKP